MSFVPDDPANLRAKWSRLHAETVSNEFAALGAVAVAKREPRGALVSGAIQAPK